MDVLRELEAAFCSRDAGRVAALFAEDYRSSFPAHPGREFTGRAQVLANWQQVFDGVPDFTAELVSGGTAADGTAYGEWHWHGHHADRSPFAMRGVTVVVVRDGRVAEGRLYLEPVDRPGPGIEETVQELYRPTGRD